MGYSLKVTGKILGVLDVFGLRALVAASEKQNELGFPHFEDNLDRVMP